MDSKSIRERINDWRFNGDGASITLKVGTLRDYVARYFAARETLDKIAGPFTVEVPAAAETVSKRLQSWEERDDSSRVSVNLGELRAFDADFRALEVRVLRSVLDEAERMSAQDSHPWTVSIYKKADDARNAWLKDVDLNDQMGALAAAVDASLALIAPAVADLAVEREEAREANSFNFECCQLVTGHLINNDLAVFDRDGDRPEDSAGNVTDSIDAIVADRDKARKLVSRLKIALIDATNALESSLPASLLDRKTRLPYEHSLSAFDRAQEILAETLDWDHNEAATLQRNGN